MTESVTGGADDYTSLTRTSKPTVPVVSDVTPTPAAPRYPYPATAGAFCAQQYPGWRGVTVTGVAVRCMSSPTDSRPRWRTV